MQIQDQQGEHLSVTGNVEAARRIAEVDFAAGE
jgi:hypothetical protein